MEKVVSPKMARLPDLTKSDVLGALASIRQAGIPTGRGSTKFCLVVGGEHIPPKYVIALAARRLLGRPLRPDEFSGGAQTNSLLEGLGFDVLACSCGGGPSTASPPPGLRAGEDPIRGSTSIVRLVANGMTPDHPGAGERILLDAFGDKWPHAVRAKFAITPGGFVRWRWPRGLSAATGWDSRAKDIEPLTSFAARVLTRVVTERVFTAAANRTQILTIGIDIIEGPDNVHAELVAVYDIAKRELMRWTGKSYPTSSQEQTLVHVVDLDSHFLTACGERVLVLGCHDLNMFSPRGRANQSPNGLRRERCDAMRALVARFKPTLVLQHPHSTDTPNIWRLPWLSLAKEMPSIRTWASGIAYFSRGKTERADIGRVLNQTKSDDRNVVDVVLDSDAYA